GRRDRDALERAEDVGEPQPHEADVPLLQRPQHELLLSVHPVTPVSHRMSLTQSCYGYDTRPGFSKIRCSELPTSPQPVPLLSSWHIPSRCPVGEDPPDADDQRLDVRVR